MQTKLPDGGKENLKNQLKADALQKTIKSQSENLNKERTAVYAVIF